MFHLRVKFHDEVPFMKVGQKKQIQLSKIAFLDFFFFLHRSLEKQNQLSKMLSKSAVHGSLHAVETFNNLCHILFFRIYDITFHGTFYCSSGCIGGNTTSPALQHLYIVNCKEHQTICNKRELLCYQWILNPDRLL